MYEPYYTCSFCDVGYNQQMHAVQTTWKGLMCSGEEFRNILNAVHDLLEIKESGCVAADARLMKVISLEDREWTVKNWYPRMLQAGFYCQALVVTKSTFNEHSIKKIVEQYDRSQVRTSYFTSMDEAFQWIKEFKNNFAIR